MALKSKVMHVTIKNLKSINAFFDRKDITVLGVQLDHDKRKNLFMLVRYILREGD